MNKMVISIAVPVGWRLRGKRERIAPGDRIWNKERENWESVDWTNQDHALEIMDNVFVITRDLNHSIRKSKQEKRKRWKLLRES